MHKNLLHNHITDSLVKENIVANVHIMDELACSLDQPIYRGKQEPPIVQYWVHLAAEFRVPEDVVTKFQTNPQSSPSKHMFEFLEARNPNYSVKDLKEGLSVISRNDLVKKVELRGLTGNFCNCLGLNLSLRFHYDFIADKITRLTLRRAKPLVIIAKSIALKIAHFKNKEDMFSCYLAGSQVTTVALLTCQGV